jgi:starvation-inducible outer membrane lipoprotein
MKNTFSVVIALTAGLLTFGLQGCSSTPDTTSEQQTQQMKQAQQASQEAQKRLDRQ